MDIIYFSFIMLKQSENFDTKLLVRLFQNVAYTCDDGASSLKPPQVLNIVNGIVQLFFLIFAQNGEAVLTSTHNLCFGAQIRKIGIPLQTTGLLYESGVRGGILFMDMFS